MSDSSNEDQHGSMTRRSLLGFSATIGGASIMPSLASARGEGAAMDLVQQQPRHSPVLTINGESHRIALDPMTTLADALRERIGLTGTKIGCNHGQCGACTVHVDGRRVLACLTLAAACEGKAVTTIEGLAADEDDLHPMQQAFIDHDAFQCGYCTPGQIMSAVALVQEGRLGSDDEIREYMSGNLCRCAAYPKILAAVRQGAEQMRA